MKNVTGGYASTLFLYWIGFAIISPFASAYLLDAGLSNSYIGLALAAAAFLAALLQPCVGAAIDKSKKVYNRHMVAVMSVLIGACSLFMWLFPMPSPLAKAAFFSINYILLMLAQPFGNALGIEYINDGYKVNFGVSRALGSFGYALSAFLVGKLIARIGAKCIPFMAMIAFFAVSVVVMIFLPALNSKENKENSLTKPVNPVEFLLKYKVFAVLLVGLVCIYFTHTLINTYALQILETKGGDADSVGTAAALAAVFELVPMLAFPVISKKIRLNNLIRIAAFFFNVKIIATLLVSTVMSFYVIQIFQMGAWGIMAISIVYYVNEVIDKENVSQGQAFAGMSMTMGTVSAALAGGRLLDLIGVSKTIVVGCIVGLVGFVLVMLTTGKKQGAD